MLLLTDTSTLLRLITGSAGDIEVTVEAHDASTTSGAITSSSTYTPVAANIPANITTATTTTIVAAPASTLIRAVRGLRLFNNHATTSNPLTLEKFDSVDAAVQWKGTLLAGEHVDFDEAGVWTLYGTDGIAKLTGVPQSLILGAFTSYPAPAAQTDQLYMFARKRAGKMNLKYVTPSGVDQVVQDKISEIKWQAYLPNNGTTVGLNLGVGWTSGGTVSHPTPSSTAPALYSQQKRTRWANVVTTTNQFLGLRTATAEKSFWRGNAAGLGGWNFHARFQIGLWPAATVRLFVGLNDSNAGWAISDTLTGDGCGFWHDTTEAATVLTFVTRDGTTATKSAAITLTTALAAGQWFDAYIYSPPNGGFIGYALVDGANGNVLVDTTTTTTMPRNTVFLGPELAMSNGTANVTVTTTAFELSGHSCQADQ